MQVVAKYTVRHTVVRCHRAVYTSIGNLTPKFQGVYLQGDVLLTFTPEATGVSWPAYVDLYCAGAKQLFLHEKPKMHLQLESVILSNL